MGKADERRERVALWWMCGQLVLTEWGRHFVTMVEIEGVRWGWWIE